MSKEIPLTKGYAAIVDDEDYEELSLYNWCVHEMSHTCYAMRRERKTRKTVLMHRQITRCASGLEVDHINHNGLDNRKANLRAVTRSENNMNRRKLVGASSRFLGVSWDWSRRKWKAFLVVKGRLKHLGYFKNEKDAAQAYNAAVIESRGAMAIVNETS